MQYNFDEIVDRENTRCAKYDERDKKFQATDIIPLWIADMDFRTAQPIIDALVKKANEGIYGYVSRPDSYFEAGANWKLRRNDWKIDTKLCSHSVGVVPAMTVMVELWSKRGDKVLIQTPVYSEFYGIVEKNGNIVLSNKLIKKEGRWTIDWVDFENKLKEVKIFLLCNPHNPLGIVWTKNELAKIVELCTQNNVLIISDEIHSDLIFNNKKFVPTATVCKKTNENVISCFSATKTFNLAGLQACTVVFPNKKLKAEYDKWWEDKNIHRNNTFSSIAMEICYNEGEQWLEQLLVYISDNFKFVIEYLEKNIPQIKTYIPDATYLMWLNCTELNLDDHQLRNFMINEAKIGLNEGKAFDRTLSGYMRLNVACPRSVLEKALDQLNEAVTKLNLKNRP